MRSDLLAPPAEWADAFDLVAEIYTVDEEDPARDPAMMPWPLTRSELEAMAGDRLTVRSVEKFLDDEDPPTLRWRAEFSRG